MLVGSICATDSKKRERWRDGGEDKAATKSEDHPLAGPVCHIVFLMEGQSKAMRVYISLDVIDGLIKAIWATRKTA